MWDSACKICWHARLTSASNVASVAIKVPWTLALSCLASARTVVAVDWVLGKGTSVMVDWVGWLSLVVSCRMRRSLEHRDCCCEEKRGMIYRARI